MLLYIDDDQYQAFKDAQADQERVSADFNAELISADDFEREQETWDNAIENLICAIEVPEVRERAQLEKYGAGSIFMGHNAEKDLVFVLREWYNSPSFGVVPTWRALTEKGAVMDYAPTLPLTVVRATPRSA